MGKLRTFFQTFFKSLISPDYYAEVVRAKFSFSLKFYLFYFFLFALAAIAYLTPTVFLPMNEAVYKLPDKVIEAYPAELEVVIKNGQASTNVEEPYFIPFPKDLIPEEVLPSDAFLEINGIQQPLANLSDLNLLVIDTHAQVTDIGSYKTLALLTENSLSYISGQGGEIRTYPLKEVEALTINKLAVFSVVQEVAPYLKYVVPVFVLFAFLAFCLFLPLGKMIYLLLFSLLILLAGKAMRVGLSYKKYYQIGLHTMVALTTLEGVIDVLKIEVTVPLFGTMVLLVITATALWGVKREDKPPVSTPASPSEIPSST